MKHKVFVLLMISLLFISCSKKEEYIRTFPEGKRMVAIIRYKDVDGNVVILGT